MLLDTLANLVSGLFTSKDKLAHDRFIFVTQNREQLDAAYRGDWIARKIIDVPPFDMTREWRDWKAEPAQIQQIEAEEQRLDVQRKVAKALRLARLYGGSALVLGVGDGDPMQPLPPIGRGGLKYLHAMHRWEITAGEIDRDVLSPTFGEPGYYQVGSTQQTAARLHPSRVIRLLGAPLPDELYMGNDGWADSVLQAVMDAVKQAGLAAQGVASLIHEAKLDVIRIPNLSQSLSAAGYSDTLIKRFTLANTMKSLNNTLLLDQVEEWDRKQISFAQLPEIMQQYLQIAAGAADIPATRLLGQAPAGMNATGESDVRNYYDRIAAEQRVLLTPTLRRLDDALIASALGSRPEEIHYAWAPLWQLSAAEAADVGLKKAQATQIYAVNDILPPAVVAKVVPNQLVEDGTYPGLEAAMEDYEAGKLEDPDWIPDPVEQAAALAAAKMPSGGPQPGQPVDDAAPRTLYVRRDVVNADEIRAWAEGQGIIEVLPDLHVTIASSRTAIDWMKIDGDWNSNPDGGITIPPGGVRIVEPLGGMTAVLLFTWSALTWRHGQILGAGASWDFEDYQPHISLTKAPVDLSKVTPYRGRIVLGPEIWEPRKLDDLPGQPGEDGGGPNADRPFGDARRGRGGGRGHYNPNQPRGPHGRWISTGASGKKAKALVDRATRDRTSKDWLVIGPVRNHAAVRAATGHDLRGWDRKITADAVRKILKDHGDPAAEGRRGQAAITRSDFKRVRGVVERPDTIARGALTSHRKLPAVVYTRKVGRYTFTVVEELQRGNKKAVLHTMWKR
ncbi:phage portal protein [Inquilinus sp.]|uniref:anti-CBASS protein Acb1 family protein n=1 Tax=Inquilinus sp. TaxID=1932117 RepID=UPI0031E2475D